MKQHCPCMHIFLKRFYIGDGCFSQYELILTSSDARMEDRRYVLHGVHVLCTIGVCVDHRGYIASHCSLPA